MGQFLVEFANHDDQPTSFHWHNCPLAIVVRDNSESAHSSLDVFNFMFLITFYH